MKNGNSHDNGRGNDNDNNDTQQSQAAAAAAIEQSRRKVLESRRQSIRSTLKFAHDCKQFKQKQQQNNISWLQSNDDSSNNNNSNNDSKTKTAVTWTAFAVAAGIVALRIGGRAALVSAVGLDFAKDNPELSAQLDAVLHYATAEISVAAEFGAFVLAWTAVKVFLFDAGGVVLALASGVLFGGVLQGALASATAATIGSYVCFALAKADTPVRKKALQVVDEYPSLRGIEKVVAQDGFKAILTLRLAPILPIPLGMYNYVYGVTNVPVTDFLAGIFFGSFKPYLLDSYLGYFGKTIMDGSAAADVATATATTNVDSMQDIILVLALGFSVLIGVFASQLAGETWDSVLQEIEAERLEKEGELDPDALETHGIATQFAGMELPQWAVDLQLDWKCAEERMQNLVNAECQAKVWNYTSPKEIPQDLNPAFWTDAPEVQDYGKGMQFKDSILDGFVLSPILASTFLEYYSDAPPQTTTATTTTMESPSLSSSKEEVKEVTTTTTKMIDTIPEQQGEKQDKPPQPTRRKDVYANLAAKRMDNQKDARNSMDSGRRRAGAVSISSFEYNDLLNRMEDVSNNMNMSQEEVQRNVKRRLTALKSTTQRRYNRLDQLVLMTAALKQQQKQQQQQQHDMTGDDKNKI